MSAQTSTSPPRSTTITVSVIACHAGLVVECPEEQAEKVAWFIEEVMVAGMNQVLNSCLDADHPERTLPRPLPYASCVASSIPS